MTRGSSGAQKKKNSDVAVAPAAPSTSEASATVTPAPAASAALATQPAKELHKKSVRRKSKLPHKTYLLRLWKIVVKEYKRTNPNVGDLALSSQSLQVIHSMVENFQSKTNEALEPLYAMKKSKKVPFLTSRDIQTAMRLLLRDQLKDVALESLNKAVHKYTQSTREDAERAKARLAKKKAAAETAAPSS